MAQRSAHRAHPVAPRAVLAVGFSLALVAAALWPQIGHGAEPAAVKKAAPFPMPPDTGVARELLGETVTFRFIPD